MYEVDFILKSGPISALRQQILDFGSSFVIAKIFERSSIFYSFFLYDEEELISVPDPKEL